MWLLPRSDPGAAAASLRPHGNGVSAGNGARLPYARLPRLLMRWMYAEAGRGEGDRLDLVGARSDHLHALAVRTTPERAEQARRRRRPRQIRSDFRR